MPKITKKNDYEKILATCIINKPLPPSLFQIDVRACSILLYLKTPLYIQDNKRNTFESKRMAIVIHETYNVPGQLWAKNFSVFYTGQTKGQTKILCSKLFIMHLSYRVQILENVSVLRKFILPQILLLVLWLVTALFPLLFLHMLRSILILPLTDPHYKE